jgi:predicted KAP-like P-loop ATPase
MTLMDHHIPIRGDRALNSGDVDRLGFADVAARVAASLIDHASDAGFVIGLDGKWGSGKSSLLYLISDALEKQPLDNRPTVITFRPWLVGNRDALLATLFNQLVTGIAQVQLAQGDASADTREKLKAVAEKARNFAASVSRAGDLLEAVPLPYVSTAGKLLKGIGKAAAKKVPDLAARKADLTEALRELGHRFIITVDDVDRLEPNEVVEVLRLVRSVADFPNITYLLCYDSAILAESIRRGADVPDGAAFLEKIVQLTVMVPQPETFQLRQWFASDLGKIVGSIPDEQASRLRTVVDREGGLRLLTPRAVVRTLDSLRFFWPALKSESIDIADLVWLLLIKDAAPGLYRWIEAYLLSAATASLGTGSMSDASIASELQELIALLPPAQMADLMYRHFFAEQLPGVDATYGTDEPGFQIYQRVSPRERDAAIRERRLASADHHRLYLALAGPSHAITQHQMDAFWQAAENSGESAADALRALLAQPISADMTKADMLLERLDGTAVDALSQLQIENLLIALSIVMDEADMHGSDYSFMVLTIWDRAERVAARLMRRLAPERRPTVLEKFFQAGPAIGWLSSLLRRETFGQGRYGDQRKREEEWMLTRDEYDAVAVIMIDRYNALSISEILAQSRPLQLLFAWAQGGETDGPRDRLASAMRSNTGLLEVLNAFVTTVNSSDRGTYEVIQPSNSKPFMNIIEIRERVFALDPKTLPPEAQVHLARVKAAFKNADDRE